MIIHLKNMRARHAILRDNRLPSLKTPISIRVKRLLLFLFLFAPPLHCMEYFKKLIKYPIAKLMWEVAAPQQYIASGDIETARWCLENGADANHHCMIRINNRVIEYPILGLAAQFGYNRDFIELLLTHGADANATCFRRTPALCYTAANGDFGSCQLLLEHGADPNKPIILDGATPLLLAASRGHAALCQLLIEHGADVNKPCVKGLTALAYAAGNGHDRICEFVRAYGAIPSQADRTMLKPFLLQAIKCRDYDQCKLLLRCGADATDPRTAPVLIRAVRDNDFEMCRLLLECGADPLRADAHQQTPLFLAAALGHAPLCTLLIEHGANVHQVDSRGYTPCGIAAMNGHNRISELLLIEHQAIPSQADLSKLKLHLFHAINHGDYDRCKLLLKCGTDATDPRIALVLIDAVGDGDFEMCRLLLECGADPLRADAHQQTPLFLAAGLGHAPLCTLLIEHGADVNQADVRGYTPCGIAAMYGHDRISELLLIEHQAIPSQADLSKLKPHLLHAIDHGDYDRCKLLLKCGTDATDPKTAPALIHAVRNNDFEMCRLLLERGADPLRTDARQQTPLFWAAGLGHAPLCVLLIEYGADIHQVDARGYTPCGIAASNRHDGICQLLHEHGATASPKDRCVLANDLLAAARNNHLNRCRLLIDCGAFLHYATAAPHQLLIEEAPNLDPATKRQKALEELLCPPRVKDETITKTGARDALGLALAFNVQADLADLLIDAGAHCSYNQFGYSRVMRILTLYPTLLKKVCYAPHPDIFEPSRKKLTTLLACIKYSPDCAQYKFPKDVQKLLAMHCFPQELAHCMIKRKMAGKRIEPRFESIAINELYAATLAQLRAELAYSQENIGLIQENYNPANHGLPVTAETIEERYGTEIQANIKDRLNRKQLRCNNVIPELE